MPYGTRFGIYIISQPNKMRLYRIYLLNISHEQSEYIAFARACRELSASLAHDSCTLFAVCELLRRGISIEEIHEITKIKHWFLQQMKELVDEEAAIAKNLAFIAKKLVNNIKICNKLKFIVYINILFHIHSSIGDKSPETIDPETPRPLVIEHQQSQYNTLTHSKLHCATLSHTKKCLSI